MAKKIAFVIEGLGGGGAQHVLSVVANHFSQIGDEISVVTMQGQNEDAYGLAPEINRVILGGSGVSKSVFSAFVNNFMRVRSLRRTIRRLDPDVVISFVGSMNVLTILASLGVRAGVIISERNDPLRQHIGFPWDRLRKSVYRYADVISANSHSALDAMSSFVPAEKLIFLPNPIRRSTVEETQQAIGISPFILSVGRLNRQKRFDLLISAFLGITSEFPDWQLVILGDGPMENELRTQISTDGAHERIHLLGFRDPTPFYANASIFVLASDYEGMPNVVLEAMSQSLPVIVTDGQVGLTGFVEDRETGLIIESGNEEALASAMTLLISETNFRDDLGANAANAVSPLQHDKSVKAWEKCVNGLLDGAAPNKIQIPDVQK